MNFEELIKNKKEELHTETPSFKVWNTIQQQLQPTKSYTLYWAVAASAIIIACLSILYFYNANNTTTYVEKNVEKEKINNVVPVSFDTTKQLDIVIETPKKRTKIPLKEKEIILSKKEIIKDFANAKPTQKNKGVNYTAQNFYDSVVLSLKGKIEATPVKFVDKEYFKVYLDEYKSLEIEETNWRKQIQKSVSQTDFVMQLIQINQRKLIVLDNLLKQINIINNKKGDTAQRNFNKIII